MKRRGPVRNHRQTLVAAAWILFAVVPAIGFGQPVPRTGGPNPGDPHQPPSALPALPSLTGPGPAAPVIPDTAIVELQWPDGAQQPTALTVVPDTVLFGDVAAIVCEFGAGSGVPAASDISWSADWLVPVDGVSNEHLDRLAAQARSVAGAGPGSEGALLIPVRVFRTDPFRISAGAQSPVIHVRGRTTDLTETAAIRAPRSWGWNLWMLAGVALAVALLFLLIARLAGRRNRLAALEDWAPPAPAWILAAGRLRALLEARDLERGQAREYLDELASIVRGYAGDRYGIAAREMTGPEIVAACRARGFDVAQPRQFARLVEEADRRRYDPDPVSIDWCREQTSRLIDQMAAVRIVPFQTPVSPEIRIAAEQSWAALVNDQSASGGATTAGRHAALTGEGA